MNFCKTPHCLTLVLALTAALFGFELSAAQCQLAYVDGLTNSSATGSIRFEGDAQLLANPDTSLATTQVLNTGSAFSCNSADCSSDGSGVPALIGAFIANSSATDKTINNETFTLTTADWRAITVKNGGILHMDSSIDSYRFARLTVEKGSTVNMTPGDYYIADLEIKGGGNAGGSQLNVVGDGTVRIYTRVNAKFADGSVINGGAPGDNAAKLFVFHHGNNSVADKILLDTGVMFSGFIYSKNQVELKDGSQVYGGISAAAEITLQDSTRVTFKNTAGIDFGHSCIASGADISHYRLEYDGLGLTCTTEPVTLKACVDSDCSNLYENSSGVTFTASTAASPSVSLLADFIGSSIVDVSQTTPDTVSLSLSATAPDAGVLCYENGFFDPLCDFVVKDSGFLFLNESDSNQLVPTQLSDKPSDSGYNSKTLVIQAVKLDSGTKACAPLFENSGVTNVQLAYQCEGSGACSGEPVTLNGAGLAQHGSYTTIALHFDADSKAQIAFKYPEAGQIKLHAHIPAGQLSGQDGELIGNSNSFVVKPFGLQLDLDGVANGTAADSDGSAFKKAGETFVLNVRAARWVDGEDGDNNGEPDDLLSLNDNGTAANFSNEILQLSHTVTHPAAPADGTLSGSIDSRVFTAGVARVEDIAWNEVGIITLNASLKDGNYLGSGNILGQLDNVGRFVPDHFAINSSGLTTACGDFTYMGQTFEVLVDLEAQNTAGQITSNYKDGHDKALLSFVAENLALNGNSTDISSRLTVGTPSWSNGAINGALAADISHSVDGPFEQLAVGLQIADGEDEMTIGINNVLDMNAPEPQGCDLNPPGGEPQCDALKLNAAAAIFRSGRLNLYNSYGHGSEALAVELFVEYYDGSTFVVSADDNCSVLASDEISLSGSATSPFSIYQVKKIDSSGNAGTTTVDQSGPSVTSTGLSAVDGVFDLTLTAPQFTGDNISGEMAVSIELGNYPWLQFDWDDDGSIDSISPTVTATFGQLRGNDRVIYWREKR